jgi:hypothetical protein
MFTIVVNDKFCFDDESRGIKDEPFVQGADTAIKMAAFMTGAKFPVTIDFDSKPIEGAYKAVKIAAHPDSATYSTPFGKAWLCPCAMKYFTDGHPDELYFKVRKTA